jgi:hypothetical protein
VINAAKRQSLKSTAGHNENIDKPTRAKGHIGGQKTAGDTAKIITSKKRWMILLLYLAANGLCQKQPA